MAEKTSHSWGQLDPIWKALLVGSAYILAILLAVYLIGVGLLAWGIGVFIILLGAPFARSYVHFQRQQRENQEGEERNRFLAHLLDIVEQAVVVIDFEGKIAYWNRFAEKLYGWQAGEVLGQSVVDVLTVDATREKTLKILEVSQKGKSWQGELDLVRRDGTRIPGFVTNTPILDGDGRPVGVVGTSTDIGEQKRREHEMEVFIHVSKALRSARTREEMVPVILDQLLTLLEADGAALATYNPTRDEMMFELGKGILNSWTGFCIRADTPILTEVFSQGQVYWNNEIRRDSRLVYPTIWEGVDSAAIAPLTVSGERVGVLVISRPGGISPEVIRLLSAIADIAANALNRSSLHEKTQLYAEQLVAVEAIGRVLAETLDLTEIYARLAKSVFDLLPDIASLFVSRFDRENELIQCVYAVSDGEVLEAGGYPPTPLEPPGHGPQSEAIRACQPVIVNDLQARLGQTAGGVGSPLPQSALFVPMISKGEVLGVMQVQSYTLQRFDATDQRLLGYVTNAAAVSIKNGELYEELQDSYVQTVLALARTTDARDTYTADHSQRLSDWAMQVAERMACSRSVIQDIRWAGMLHDIGKIGVPDAILRKPGPLTPEEWEIMRRHPQTGEEILAPVKKLQGVAPIVGAHHERYDGKGYPRGLKGEQIPLGGRIITVVDAYGAMTDERVYRKAMTHAEAVAELQRNAGTQFDPQVVEVFLGLLEETEIRYPWMEKASLGND